jgi:hypothetical protein
MNPLRIFGSIAARRRGDWQYGMPFCAVNPDDKAVVDAVARGIGTVAGEAARLQLTTGKHSKTEAGEGR